VGLDAGESAGVGADAVPVVGAGAGEGMAAGAGTVVGVGAGSGAGAGAAMGGGDGAALGAGSGAGVTGAGAVTGDVTAATGAVAAGAGGVGRTGAGAGDAGTGGGAEITGATVTPEGGGGADAVTGGLISRVYSRTRRPDDQLASRMTSMKGSRAGRSARTETTARPSGRLSSASRAALRTSLNSMPALRYTWGDAMRRFSEASSAAVRLVISISARSGSPSADCTDTRPSVKACAAAQASKVKVPRTPARTPARTGVPPRVWDRGLRAGGVWGFKARLTSPAGCATCAAAARPRPTGAGLRW